MRQTYIAGFVAGALMLTTLTVPAHAQEGAAQEDTPVSPSNALKDTIDSFAALSDATSSAKKDAESNKDSTDGKDSKDKPKGLIEALEPNPEKDPMYIDPEKNPLKKVSSSEMFTEWTDDMEEGEGKEFVQAWAKGSSIPDTANPVELWKMEAQGSAKMGKGLFTGDFAMSSEGSSQRTSVWLTVVIGMIVIGQVIEPVMRGVRMATQ